MTCFLDHNPRRLENKYLFACRKWVQIAQKLTIFLPSGLKKERVLLLPDAAGGNSSPLTRKKIQLAAALSIMLPHRRSILAP
jgi:hypothetical protein